MHWILFEWCLIGSISTLAFVNGIKEDTKYWEDVTKAELEAALKLKWNTGRAKNVILFIGDGMGPTTVTATRIYHKSESGKLSYEEFPHFGMIKTYSADKIVPDSASTATAIFTGVKVNQRTGGVDATVKQKACKASMDKSSHLKGILHWAHEAGKYTGFVTTTRVTHATPMSLYAHTAERNWECEASIPPEEKDNCKDIARQLVEDEPGKNIRVVMGGGRQVMISHSLNTTDDPIDAWCCYRKDGKNLIDEWTADKKNRKVTYAVATNNQELDAVNTEKTDFLLGIFGNSHMPYEHARNKGPSGTPSLRNMTETAVKILKKCPNGYLLMVEGGLIDFAHHRGHARVALNEASEMSDTVKLVMELTSDEADETLIIVTADHAHALTISGYPNRGTGVLGIAEISKMDKIPFTTLTYATGGPNNFQFTVADGKVVRADPRAYKTDDYGYSQQALIYTDEAHHSGTDVAVYATGPMAHLFHSLHEQPYIARVIAYAAKIGPYAGTSGTSRALSATHCLTSIVVFTIWNLFQSN